LLRLRCLTCRCRATSVCRRVWPRGGVYKCCSNIWPTIPYNYTSEPCSSPLGPLFKGGSAL